MNDYNLFIFDFGGVMQDDSMVWQDFFEKLGFGRKEVRDFGKNATEAVEKMLVGNMEEKEFWEKVQSDIGSSFPCSDLLYSIWKSSPVQGMRELVLKIRSKGFRVICGTNNIYPFWKRIRDYNMYDVFDKVYSSFAMHIAKPDIEFWKYIAREEKTDFKNMFFVDDRLENCKAAASLGIKVHHLTNGSEGLRKELVSLGIDLS